MFNSCPLDGYIAYSTEETRDRHWIHCLQIFLWQSRKAVNFMMTYSSWISTTSNWTISSVSLYSSFPICRKWSVVCFLRLWVSTICLDEEKTETEVHGIGNPLHGKVYPKKFIGQYVEDEPTKCKIPKQWLFIFISSIIDGCSELFKQNIVLTAIQATLNATRLKISHLAQWIISQRIKDRLPLINYSVFSRVQAFLEPVTSVVQFRNWSRGKSWIKLSETPLWNTEHSNNTADN